MDNTQPVYNGLHEQPVYLVDTSATSPALFVIKEFPTQLNAGKNLFKLRGHPRNLREDSLLYIEILDYNNEPIFHEVSELSEEDGSVVIVIHINNTTPPGNCTITVVGEALYIDDKAVPVEWQNRSNVMWQRTVLVNSSKTNTAEILFNKKPTISVQEQISVQLDRVYDTTQIITYDTGSVQFISNNGTPILNVSGGNFSSDMLGGVVTITTPQNPTPISKYITGSIPYESIIDKVLSTSSILLRSNYIIDPSQSIYGHRYDNFDTSNYSIKYTAHPTYTPTENSESYALIEINDLQPDSGDIARIKIFSNNSGTIGNWDLLSDVVLGDTELFITDTGSIEPYIPIGTIKANPYTYYDTYAFNGFKYIDDAPNLSYSNDNLPNALYINSARNISAKNSVDIVKILDQYNDKFIKNASYKFTLNAIGNRTAATGNTDPIISFYLSGSAFNTDYTDYYNQELPIKVGKRIGYLQSKGNKERFDDNTIIFTADNTGTGVLYYVIEGGQWEISDIHVTTNNEPGYTPNYTRIRTKIPTKHKSGVQQTFKVEYYNSQGVKSNVTSISDPISWEGGNHYIDGDYNLITGSLFVADKLTTGIEFRGRGNSGMIRTVGYTGFNAKNKGIMIWSGSALSGSTDDYKGTGVEMYESDDNYFRFATDASETSSLYVKTKTFYLGNSSSFISSDGGTITMSGSIVFDSVTVPTASYAISSSRTLTASYYAETDPIFTVKSGSLATTGSNIFSGSQTITGNLTVFGTASFVYTTASIIEVGSNIITLNTDNPSIRFGGITVVDSGSFGNDSTGSLLWDSQNNRWVYSNPSGSAYDGGMLISGPRNTSGLGNEVGVTNNFLVVGNGADHISSSVIFHSGSVTQVTGSLTVSGSSRVIGTLNADGVQFIRQYNTSVNVLGGSLSVGKSSTANATLDVNGNTIITGSLTVTTGITASLLGTASWSNNAITASYITTSQTASYVLNAVSSSQSTNSLTASYVVTAQTASYFFTSSVASSSFSTNSVSSSLAQTASYVLNAVSASYSTNSATASYISGTVISSSYAVSASYSNIANTASYAQIANTSSYTISSSFATNANTASYVLNAISSSYTNFANTASYVLNAISSSFASTASYILNAVSASYSVSSSFATNSATASYIVTAQTASYVTLAQTASYVVTAQTASYVLNAVSSSFALTASFVNPLNQAVNISGSLNLTGSIAITGSTATDLVRITQTGTGNAFVVEDSTNPDSSPFVISSSGNVGIGTSAPSRLLSVNGVFGVQFSNTTESFAVNPTSTGVDFVIKNASNPSLGEFRVDTRIGQRAAYYNGGNFTIGSAADDGINKLQVNGNVYATSYTGSLFGSVIGNLTGTASYSTNAATASFVTTAQTASYFFTSSVTSASFATSASRAVTASYFFTASVTSASFATNAISAVSASNVYINYGINIDTEYPILFSTTSGSYTPIFTDTNILYNTLRDRLTVTNISSSAITSSLFGTASWANNAITASYVVTAQTASYFLTSSVTSASFAQTASYFFTSSVASSSLAQTASYVVLSQTASYVLNSVSASFASTASYFLTSSVTSASFATNSTNAATASYVVTSQTASYVNQLKQNVIITGSLRIGDSTIASGNASHAEGLITQATGNYSHAEGVGTIASGSVSHAEGSYSNAYGYGSHAEGNGTFAYGDYSNTKGLGTIASGSYQLAIGQYSIASSDQSAFIIGNGTNGGLRSNLVFASGSIFQVTGSIVSTANITASAFVTREALITSTTLTANTGITTIYSIPTASYDGAWFDYTIRSGSNARAGTIFGLWSSSAVNYAETTTTDFGSTANFTFGMSINGSNMILSSSTTTNGWTVNSIIRGV